MKTLEMIGKDVNEAVENALRELSLTRDDIDYKVIQEASKGFLGLFGAKPAKVLITVKDKKEEVSTKKLANTEEETKKSDSQYEKIARDFLRDVLNSMNVMAEIHIKETRDSINVNLVGPDMGILIGRRGETLDALQYLLSLVVNKVDKEEKYKRVTIDTENYRKKREETLIRLANKLASKVKRDGEAISLEPMNPYERRIIHAALQNNKFVATKSEGEEPFRKVVIVKK